MFSFFSFLWKMTHGASWPFWKCDCEAHLVGCTDELVDAFSVRADSLLGFVAL